jgi:hypothetical protein
MQTIQQAVASVQNAPSSIFTREDVINLLNGISAPKGGIQIDRQIIKDLCEEILDTVKDNARSLDSSEVCDLSTAEFSLNYNELSLDSVDIDTDQIAENVVNGIYDTIEEFFETLEEENKPEDGDEENEESNN